MDEDGAALDISGATLAFTMIPLGGGTAVVDGAAASNDQVDADTLGAWSYSWAAADTAAPGYYRAEVQVTHADDTIETFPNDGDLVVKITPELG